MKIWNILCVLNLIGLIGCDNSTELKSWNDTFKTEEITFESDGYSLEGTLTMPNNSSKVSAILIANGDGLDRDGTYPSDPNLQLPVYKTWSETIANNGIAVLRYDQRFITHSIDLMQFTLGDRINDIAAAIRYLKIRAEIDSNKIFIVGHSQGGCIGPVAAQKENVVAGVAIINSNAFAIDTLVIEKLKAIGLPTSYITDIINRFELLRNNTYSTGWSYSNRGAIFWKEWINYTENADSICISLGKPAFIVQCGADETFTSNTRQKNIDKWENISNQSSLIELKNYDGVTHYLLESGTEETAIYIINDLINWIKKF